MPTRSYTVGQFNTVLRRDEHTGPWISIAPIAPQFTGVHWYDIMAFPGEPDRVVAVGSISSQVGIIVSNDAGVTWNVPGGNWSMAGKIFHEVWVVDNTNIWAVAEGGWVVKSTDGGLTFNNPDPFNNAAKPGNGAFDSTFAIHAISGLVAVVGGSQGPSLSVNEAYAWKTIDGGNSWITLNTGATYPIPIPPSLRNAQVQAVFTTIILNGGTGYPANGSTPTSTSGSGLGAIMNFASTAGVVTATGITAGGDLYNVGDTLTLLDGNNDCVLEITGIAAGNPTGQPGGIWMSPNQQRIIVSTNYTQQLSTDGGNTFAPILPEPTRSGRHLTWYPSHDASPTRFRHTGGPVFHVLESLDQGTNWSVQRQGEGIIMQGAHFYSPQNGYYLVLNQIWSTSNGGVTGDVATYTDVAQLQLESVWTEESLPIDPCYQFTPCDPQASPTYWNGAILNQYNGQIVDVIFDLGTSIETTVCGTISQVSNSTSCTEHEITIGTDSPAGSITYTDCNGNIQVITYDAVIPPQHFQALIFNICVLDGTTPVLSPGGVTTSIGDPCGTPDPCSLANPFSPSNVVIGTYTDCDTCLGPAPSFPCYNLISCTPETCPDILYATDIELAPYVGQYIEINGNNNCRYLVTATRQGYFTSGLNPLILSNPAGNFQLGLDDHTIQVTSVIVNSIEYVPGVATPYIVTPANYAVVECTDLVCIPVPINTTENCVTNLPTYLNNVFANQGVPYLTAECADPSSCEGLLNTFLTKIQYPEGTTFSITFTIQSNSGILTYVYTGVGGNVTGLEIINNGVTPPEVLSVLTCNSQSECTGNPAVDTTQPILTFAECTPTPQIELGEPCPVRPRLGQPGFTWNGCDPKMVVTVKSKFADSVYALYKRMAYGIETCCEFDLDKIDVKNMLLDLGRIYDPELCVPGQAVPYGCCPQPCDAEATVEIPQFMTCPAPENAIAVLDTGNPPVPALCPAPEGPVAPIITLAMPAVCVDMYWEIVIPPGFGSLTITLCNGQGYQSFATGGTIYRCGDPNVPPVCTIPGTVSTVVGPCP